MLQVSANDPDRGENGRVLYRIETPDPSESGAPLEIDPNNGSITVKNPFTFLDYDGVIQVSGDFVMQRPYRNKRGIDA